MAIHARSLGRRPSLLWIGLTAVGAAAGLGRRKAPAPQTPFKDAEVQAAAEPGRGRAAEQPTHIESRGWRDVAKRTYAEINADRLPMVSAAIAFYGFLSLFPALAALVSIYGLFADPATIGEHLQAASSVLPAAALELVGAELTRISQAGEGALGIGFAVGLALSLWSANAATKSVFDALNIVYEEEEKRSFLALNLWSLGFTLAGILLLIAALGAVVAVPVVLSFVGLSSATEWLIAIVRWPLLMAVVAGAITALYRYGPSRERARWSWIAPGAGLAALVWVVASLLFSWYVASFADYNKTYGSLGAVVGMMMWMWLSVLILLAGAQLNAELEHQTARDTTSGGERPLGQRGAVMADSVGAKQG